MTIGHWLDEAHQAFAATAKALERRGRLNVTDINVALACRSQVYSQLARVTEVLVGRQIIDYLPHRGGPDRPLATPDGTTASRLYVGLRLAVEPSIVPQGARAVAGPGRAWAQAADAIGIVSEILNSHVPRGAIARTPEGQAIRNGGGVAAGLGEVARLTEVAVRLDRKVPGWLRRVTPLPEAFQPHLDAAAWSSSPRRFAEVIREITSEAPPQTALRSLDIPGRQPRSPAPAVNTPADALTALDSARLWMWQHPDQVSAAHLAAGTRLGLAVHYLAGGDTAVTDGWRRAALAASDLGGAPLRDAAAAAADELTEALRWVRGLNASTVDRQHLEPLTEKLPGLAGALDRGLRGAVGRRALFVKGDETRLISVPGSPVAIRAADTWRVAHKNDPSVLDVMVGLRQTYDRTTAAARVIPAALAFPQSRARQAERGGASPRPAPARGRHVDAPLER